MASSRSKNVALGGGGEGSSGGLERKQLITMRLLTRPPPPCGNLVKMPRKMATAENTRPAKIMIAGVLLVVASGIGVAELAEISCGC